jgi:hypothetical protein
VEVRVHVFFTGHVKYIPLYYDIAMIIKALYKINEHIPYIVVFLFRRVTSYIGIYFITK